MGIKNPDILIPQLDELNNTFQKWNYFASDIVSESDRLQNYSSSILSQQKQKVEISKNLVENDANSIQRIENEIDLLNTKCDNELVETNKLLIESQKVFSESESALKYWEEELNKAISWLERAKERLKQAEIEYENAKIQLQLAKEELRRAEQALKDCENSETTDKDGNKSKPDCSFEKTWVREAQKQVSIASQNLRIAENELNDAKKEVSEATECVNLCKAALKLATTSLSNAKHANKFSTEANFNAERSKEECNSALNSIKMAEKKLTEEKELINNANSLINKSIIHLDESLQNNKRAIELTDSAQNYSSKGIQDLSIRLDFLRKFASPITIYGIEKKSKGISSGNQNDFFSSIEVQSFEIKNNPALKINKDNAIPETELIKLLSRIYPPLNSNYLTLKEIKLEQQHHLKLLSFDPIKKEHDEYEGELGLISQGVFGQFVRDKSGRGDFISIDGKYRNKVFDVFGIPQNAINNYENRLKLFFDSTDKHFYKILSGNVDYLIIDTRAMNKQQKSEIRAYINSKWSNLKNYLFWIN